MGEVQSLPSLLADLTTRQRQEPGSRNRPIRLYAVNNETVNLIETVTTRTATSFKWSDGVSDDRLVWNEGQWS